MGEFRLKLAFRPRPILRLDMELEFTLKLMTIGKAYFIRQLFKALKFNFMRQRFEALKFMSQ
jgi:hypothetical protein